MLQAKFNAPCQAAGQYGQERILFLCFFAFFPHLPSSWHICQFLAYSFLKENEKKEQEQPPRLQLTVIGR